MKLGVLTGGGDAPGLNAVIRGVVRQATADGHEVIGFRDGWKGVMDNEWMPLDIQGCRGLLTRGGTVLGATRINPFMREDCLLYTSPSPRDATLSRMPSSA